MSPKIPLSSIAAGGVSGTDTGVAGGGSDNIVLQASGLEKTYRSWLPWSPSVEVLSGTGLTVRAGELVGIVGGNGSGKSTLMKILVGVLDQDAGEVERGGTIGWCPQETLLYDRLTVRETFRLFGEGYGLSTAEIEGRVDWLADRLDFGTYLDTRIDRLSGGNRQKVNLSIALLHEPDVLLLDEPYTGFDWETYQAFWGMADDLAAQGTAVVLISHLLEEHHRLDRLYELRDGRLEESDPVATVAQADANGERTTEPSGEGP